MRDGTRLELMAAGLLGALCLLASACGSGDGLSREPDGAVSAGGAGGTGTTTHGSGGTKGLPGSSAQGGSKSNLPDTGILADAAVLSDAAARIDVTLARDADRDSASGTSPEVASLHDAGARSDRPQTQDADPDLDAGASSDAELVLYGLTAGPFCFKVTSIAPGYRDGCDLGVESIPGLAVLGNYEASTGIFTLGASGSLGSGAIRYNRGTLLRPRAATSDGDLSGCTWSQADTTLLTMTDTNKFTVSVTETQDAFSTACGVTTTSCTSTWTWTMEASGPQMAGMCP